MNFELEDKLSNLLQTKELDLAIQIAEEELKKIPETGFHQILGKNLKHLSMPLKKYISDFNFETIKTLRKKQGLFKSIFGSKEQLEPAAYYCEMNGFTINYDRWFIDLFSYKVHDEQDWDWLSDFYDSTSQNLTIIGFEEIQNAFRDVHEDNRFNESNIRDAYDICELLVILRLQELFREAYQNEQSDWAKIPMFITAHDYEMIYRVN